MITKRRTRPSKDVCRYLERVIESACKIEGNQAGPIKVTRLAICECNNPKYGIIWFEGSVACASSIKIGDIRYRVTSVLSSNLGSAFPRFKKFKAIEIYPVHNLESKFREDGVYQRLIYLEGRKLEL